MNPILDSSSSLAELFDASTLPVYAVDRRRQIVYCNRALADWLGLARERVVGRYVEYHSEPAAEHDQGGVLADLCPPPAATAGRRTEGTISCATRGGRLVHRHAEFIPLAALKDEKQGNGSGVSEACAVLAIVAAEDLSTDQLTAELTANPSTDELHRTIRRLRRELAGEYAIDSLLGISSAMRKVRDQIAAAATSRAHVLVCGPAGSGRSHVARAIHYRRAAEQAKFVSLDCQVLTEDRLRRAIDSLQPALKDGCHTLLVQRMEHLSPELAAALAQALGAGVLAARVVATTRDAAGVDPALFDAVSTITICVPPLAERLEDLPLVVQCFIEASNRGNAKQVGGIQPAALDRLALYHWPGELDELREVVIAAHTACGGTEITVADLPAVVGHAAQAAALAQREVETIVLDDFLATIERELVERALTQARGNKTEAARLLGLTRPRLYRRLEQLGLGDPPETKHQPPAEEASS